MEFRVLGPLEVEEEGRVLKLGGAKQRGATRPTAPPRQRGRLA